MASTITADNGVVSGSAGIKSSADSSGVLALASGTGTTAVTIDTSQNVGIGAGSPSTFGKLAVNVNTNQNFYASNNSGVTEIGSKTNDGSGYNSFAVSGYDVRIKTNNGTERARFDENGNVGVGTTIGSGKFTIDYTAPATFTNAASDFVSMWRASGTNALGVATNTTGTTVRLVTNNGYQLAFNNGSSEAARIDSSGNFVLGTTSAGITNTNSFWVAPSYFGHNHASGTASGSAYAYFGYNGSSIGSISQNGTTGVLYNLTSDYRLKNDPQPLTGAKEFVMALQPKKWQWWDGSGEGVGFIAHEFMEVAKYSGNGEKDAVDADGNPVYQSIQPSSSEVMANLVSLLQEQQALINNLTERLAALEGAK